MPTLLWFLLVLFLSVADGHAAIIDAPHDPNHGVGCGDCHSYSLWWNPAATTNGTAPATSPGAEILCRKCHAAADLRRGGCGHSHQTMGEMHNPLLGDWRTGCLDCHDPHRQAQLDWQSKFPAQLYLATGTIEAEGLVFTGPSLSVLYFNLDSAQPEWSNPDLWGRKNPDNPGRGLTAVIWDGTTYNTYEVLNAGLHCLAIKGSFSQNQTELKFGLIYGRLLKAAVRDQSGQPQAVKFFAPHSATAGLANPAPDAPGLCQICHTKTKFWTADGAQTDHYPARPCVDCHVAALGFKAVRRVALRVGSPTEILLQGWQLNAEPLTYTLRTEPESGQLSGTPPRLIYTPAPTFSGQDSFSYTVQDGQGREEIVTVLLQGTAENDLPVAEPLPLPAPELGPPGLQFAAAPATIRPGETATLTWTATNARQGFIEPELGPVGVTGNLTVAPVATTTYTLTVSGPQGSSLEKATVYVQGEPAPLPVDSFAKNYEATIPADATVAAYQADRFSLLTGEVTAVDGQPLAGVAITIVGRPEYGTAWSTGDGRFTMPVEGGATYILAYAKEGFLPLQRQAAVGWNAILAIEPVQLRPPDPAATTITFNGDPDTVFVHQATLIAATPGESAHGATVVMRGDTRAQALDENGQTMQTLPTVTLRVTEVPTPAAMPAELPPTSAFTYCAEFQVDGVKKVAFNKPVAIWLHNFLGFAVGEVVPVGYYNQEKAVWEPMPNGVVVELLDRDRDGLVDALDSDGDGQADDLNHDGRYDDEVVGLNEAGIYHPGDTCWRVLSNHFSTLDFNWAFTFPPDATPPDPPTKPDNDTSDKTPPGCNKVNSYVDHRSQVYHKDIAIPGSDVVLHYASERVAGYRARITVPASGANVPSSLREIRVSSTVAGRTMTQILPPAPHQQAEFYWDWTDHLGQTVSGQVGAEIKIGYVYRGEYMLVPLGANAVGAAFGQPGNRTSGIRSRQNLVSWQTQHLPLAKSEQDLSNALAAGWSLANVNWLAPADPVTLHQGDGRTTSFASIISTVAGNGEYGVAGAGDGGLATAARMGAPSDVTLDGQGNLYVVDVVANEVRKIDGQGVIGTVAGDHSRQSGYNGDELPATQARLHGPRAIVFDRQGNLYIADTYNHRIRKVDGQGIITTVAGNGQAGYSGDNGPAVEARLKAPSGLAVDNHGNLYIADTENNRIRKVDPTGVITTLAGNGSFAFGGDGGPASAAKLKYPFGLALDRSGNLFVADSYNHRIRRIDPSGIISTIAGNGSFLTEEVGDQIPARETAIVFPQAVTVDGEGNVYFSDTMRRLVRKVDLAGILTTVAGNGSDTYYFHEQNGDGGLPTQATLCYTGGMTIDAAGNFYVADPNTHVVRKITTPFLSLPGMTAGELALTDADGVAHIFTAYGRHLRSVDPATGVILQSLEYDGEGRLTIIRDRFGRSTTIERNRAGQPIAVVATTGLRTNLTIDRSNTLTAIATPDGGVQRFSYNDGELLTTQIDPAGHRFDNYFDRYGRLTDFTDQAESHYQYQRQGVSDGTMLTIYTNGVGESTSYKDLIDRSGGVRTTVTDPAGAVTEITSDAGGLHTTRALSCGVTEDTTYGLDPLGGYKFVSAQSRTTPAGLTDSWTTTRKGIDLDEDGQLDQLQERISHLGREFLQVKELHSATITTTSPLGRTAVVSYDRQTLLPAAMARPGFYLQTLTYDSDGQLVALTVGERRTAFTYDSHGFLLSQTDPEQRLTSYTHDSVGRVTGITQPDGSRTQLAYDANGNLTELQTPNGARHLFAYNDFNATDRYTAPLSGTTSYYYDRARRLTAVLYPSGLRIDTRYSQGQVARIDTPEGPIEYGYLCSNKLGQVGNRNATIRYTYDGPLPTAETLSGVLNHTATYSYNQDFSLANSSYAGAAVGYGYDADGLLTTAGPFTIERRAENGLPERVSDGVVTVSRSFNGYGELDRESTTVAGQLLAEWQGERDKAGRLLTKSLTVAGQTVSHGYTYDLAGRLTGASRNGSLVEEYQYIANNERSLANNTLRGLANQPYAYSEEDHILTAGPASYQFDVDGFLASRTEGGLTTNYFYSSRGELVRVELADGRRLEYLYDPFQRRLAKLINGTVVEKYLWQGLTRLLAVYDGQDRLRQRFEYGDGRLPLAFTMGNQRYYLAYDQNGSPVAVADSSGRIVKQLDYDAFGNVIADSAPEFAIPFGFAGGLRDEETGLVHFGYRDYDPALGRWVAKDPILFAGGDPNLYGYVQNDPINWVDILGLELTQAQQAAVQEAVQDWSNSKVPYAYGGSGKNGADCSGAVSGIYKQAGVDIGRLSSGDFSRSQLFGPATGSRQIGDVGVTPGHVVIYGGDTGVTGRDVWSASRTGGPVFGPVDSSVFSGGAQTWYRYK